MTDLSAPAFMPSALVKDLDIGDKRVEYYKFGTPTSHLVYEQYYLAADDADFKELYNKVCEQAAVIKDLIAKKILAPGLYAEVMGTDPKSYRILYGNNITGSTLANLIDNSYDTYTAMMGLRSAFRRVLTSYIILYQKIGMIHGAFTYDNIYLSGSDGGQPIIAGWGMMEKAPCKAHISEFIWFLLQLKPYIMGDTDSGKKPKPWLKELINPVLEPLFSMSDLPETNAAIESLSTKTTKQIFDAWLI